MNSLSALNSCHSILDLRECARRRLPRPVFDFLDSGAESEITAQRNIAALDEENLIPRCLVDVGSVRTASRVLGQDIEWPLICSPTGASQLFHPDGELAVARAAAKTGTLYTLSIASTCSIEDVAAACSGPKMFQLYFCKDRDFMCSLISRCKRSCYAALCLTVDTPVLGKRERAMRSGFTIPLKWSLSNVVNFARRPRWVLGQLRRGLPSLAHFVPPDGRGDAVTSFHAFGQQIDWTITWRDVREIADLWRGPLAIKGIMSADDARHAVDAGATAIIVSNHGGRQMDGAIASFEALPEIAKAVGDRAEIILDGGIRRGVHVVKALARGANACSIGRPYLYGLSAGGEAGVAKALEILRTELVLSMRLAGCPDLDSIRSGSITYPAKPLLPKGSLKLSSIG